MFEIIVLIKRGFISWNEAEIILFIVYTMIKVMLISIALYIYFFLIKNIQDRLKNTDKQYE